jgi:hypothetical protein
MPDTQGTGGWLIRRFPSLSTSDGIPAAPCHQTGTVSAVAAMRICPQRQDVPKRGGNRSHMLVNHAQTPSQRTFRELMSLSSLGLG